MPNRLIHEISPYLRQHADDPVDWYPWGEEAFAKARREDRPILLSVGYSACHWCHVMQRESFRDPETARLMNRLFVNIKVDREERPDIDALYMGAVQAMTGQGGWPMTLFLTPSGEPFFAGTYFPPEDRHGLPSFKRVLLAVASAYRERKGEVVRTARGLAERLRRAVLVEGTGGEVEERLLERAYEQIAQTFDAQDGGFGPPPKFPQPPLHQFLLRYAFRTSEPRPLEMVVLTLERMARGGIYDQLGGGFHRYAVDRRFIVPHFEKMLYDNALLARLYLNAYQATGKELFRRVASETLDYLLGEMRSPEGGFYSAQDAESGGEEGAFYLWTEEEILNLLGPEEGALVNAYYGVTREGNFEGRNLLHIPHDPEAFAARHGVSLAELEEILRRAQAKLLEMRRQRRPPARDEKILTSWNGLAIQALAEAAPAFGRQDLLEAAVACAQFLTGNLKSGGRLLHVYGNGQAKVEGYLEDYAFLAEGLISLYEATLDPRWLEEAMEIASAMISRFWEEGDRMFFDTARDGERLIVRPRTLFDGATPCGSSAATMALLRLAALTGQEDYLEKAVAALKGVGSWMERVPLGAGYWLCALDWHLAPKIEIAIIAPAGDPIGQALLQTLSRHYLPNRVVAGFDPSGDRPPLPLLKERDPSGGRPTVYLCRAGTCLAPITDPEALEGALSKWSQFHLHGS